MIRAADVTTVVEDEKKNSGYVSSDEESSKSDKENQRVCSQYNGHRIIHTWNVLKK